MRTKQIETDSWFLNRMIWSIVVLILGIVSCKNDNLSSIPEGVPFDPSKPVVVSDFTPKSGEWGSDL